MASRIHRLLQAGCFSSVLVCAGAVPASAATFTVVNTANSGAGSLRQAIEDANSNSGPDRIEFNIPGGGVQTISPVFGLPVIFDAVTIDGFTQPGSNSATSPPTVMVEISGDALSEGAEQGLIVGGVFSPTTIRGLAINGGFTDGILIQSSAQVTVEGCYIGTDPGGTLDRGVINNGIVLESATANCTVGGALPNHIGGNGADGVRIEGAEGITVQGNRIGVQRDGTSALGNGGHGISIDFFFFSEGMLIGGTTAGQGNAIGYNGGDGVSLLNSLGTADQVRILGNNIFSNVGLGIDLNNDGVTLNDAGDVDTGTNELFNYPVLETAFINPAGTMLTVQGWARPGSSIELFRGDVQAAGVFGEGVFLARFDEGGGSDTDNTSTLYTGLINGVNQGTDTTNRFNVTIAVPAGVVGGTYLTSTATLGNRTSEFGATVRVLGPPASIDWVQQPTNAGAGAAIAPAMAIELLDAGGQRCTQDDTSQITLSINNNPGGSVLSGTVTQTVTDGLATFAGLSLNMAGTGYTLDAARTGLPNATSEPFNITAGAADHLAFGQQPTDSAAGQAIAPAVTVRVEDALGNLVNVDGTAITLAIGNNPGSGTLSGTLTRNTAGGVASFDDLSIDLVGVGYTLAASATGLTGATSTAFNVTAGAASWLAFVQQPTDTTAGQAISPAVTVRIEDALGNLVPVNGTPITLAIDTNPAGGTLSGTLTQNSVSGVATFAGLSVDRVGVGYTLAASSSGFTGDGSLAFNITAADAARLAFAQEPTNAVAGATISPAVTVRVEDALGNLINVDGTAVTLAFGTNPSGATLSGTLTRNTSAGVATFADLSVDLVGVGYTLTAASPGLTGDTSATFDITAADAARLAFAQEPTDAVAGATISPAVTVRVEDALGNLINVDGTAITLAFGTNSSGATLSGTLTRNTSAGVATFADLSVDLVGVGYTLTAASPGLTGDTSVTFNVAAAAGNRLVFGQQPSDTVAGAAIAPAVTARIEDAFGNAVAVDATAITLAIGTNPAGGTLSGTLTQNTVDGVATFADLSFDRVGTGYTLAASSPGLTGAISDPFDITAGAANRLAFAQQPTDTAAGATITPAVSVRLEDAFGNLLEVDGTAITLAIGTNPGAGTLSGTLTRTTAAGVATFSGLSIDLPGTGYTLVASSTGLTAATSNAFDIVAGDANRLQFVQQPTDANAGVSITPAVTVRLVDAVNNPLATNGVAITLAVGANPAGGTLAGTLTQTTTSGLATFPGLSLDNVGTGYTLVASSTGLVAATSDPFDILALPAIALEFVQQPTNTVVDQSISPPVSVRLVDAAGGLVATSGVAITVAIGANPAAATLAGTLTQNTVGGVATFNGLSIDQAGIGYSLVASSAGLTNATSATFTITGLRLAFVQQPTSTTVGATMSPSVTVQIEDAAGNPQALDGEAITLAVATNPGPGTLTGTLTRTTAAGVATFDNLSLDTAGVGYTLTASHATAAGATSDPFDVTIVTIGSSTLSAAPTSVPADGTETSTLTITVLDGAGAPLAGIAAARLSLTASPPAGVTLAQPTTATDVNGQTVATARSTVPGLVTFSLAIDGADTGQTAAVTFIQTTSLAVTTDIYFIGFPVQQGSGSPLETLGKDGAWRQVRWDEPTAAYVPYDPATDGANAAFFFPRGTGHYVRWDFARTLQLQGEPPNTAVAVPLTLGWTTLANPFTTELPWALDQFTIRETATGTVRGTLADRSLWNTVRPYAWRFNRTSRAHELVFPTIGAADELQVYDGFWMYAEEAGLEVVLSPPSGIARTRGRQASPSASQWSAAISASDGQHQSNIVIGVDGQLSRALPIEAAPAPDPEAGVELRVVTPSGRYAGQLDRPSNRLQWELAAISSQGGPVTLSWPSLGRGLPAGLLLSILDRQTGQRTALNGRAAYSYNAPPGQERRFQLVAEPFGNQRSTITDLRAATSRAAGSHLSLTLSGPASITVTIRGLGGRIVRTLRDEAAAAGTIAVTWDGRDEQGRAVPAGTYRAEAVASGPLGLSHRVVRTIVVE